MKFTSMLNTETMYSLISLRGNENGLNYNKESGTIHQFTIQLIVLFIQDVTFSNNTLFALTYQPK